MLSAFKRNSFNSVTVLLESKDSFAAFARALGAIPASTLEARREQEYRARNRAR